MFHNYPIVTTAVEFWTYVGGGIIVGLVIGRFIGIAYRDKMYQNGIRNGMRT